MRMVIDFSDEDFSDDGDFRAMQEKTGLDLRGVLNEALNLYQRAVKARADGKQIGIIDEGADSYSPLRMPGLDHVRASPPTESKPGGRMPDGTIYAGISPDTHQPMYTTSADAPLTWTFNEARKFAEKLDANGHKDWRVPTKSELNVLWENRDKGALKGTFNVTGSNPAGWYWSSTGNYYGVAWGQRFSDGNQNWGSKGNDSSLRCVR